MIYINTVADFLAATDVNAEYSLTADLYFLNGEAKFLNGSAHRNNFFGNGFKLINIRNLTGPVYNFTSHLNGTTPTFLKDVIFQNVEMHGTGHIINGSYNNFTMKNCQFIGIIMVNDIGNGIWNTNGFKLAEEININGYEIVGTLPAITVATSQNIFIKNSIGTSFEINKLSAKNIFGLNGRLEVGLIRNVNCAAGLVQTIKNVYVEIGEFNAYHYVSNYNRSGVILGQALMSTGGTLNIENCLVKVLNYTGDDAENAGIIGRISSNNGTINLKNNIVYIQQFKTTYSNPTQLHGQIWDASTGITPDINLNNYFNTDNTHLKQNLTALPYINFATDYYPSLNTLLNDTTIYDACSFDLVNVWEKLPGQIAKLRFISIPFTPTDSWIKVDNLWEKAENVFIKKDNVWTEVLGVNKL